MAMAVGVNLTRNPPCCKVFAPHPQPLPRWERGARDLIPLLLGEKGLGDEGARYLYNACPI
ncbi:hypothetical protein FDUTEX481_02142 [Tolypothrix sp. PCC 7601]|nr:hypothetical protein FDUTEX481_02142 [Tolypothrix sp. PCC 7601]